MRINKNILVTGCGGDIGQSIGKILKQHLYTENLFGCDISDKNAGKFIYNNFFISLPCSHPEYFENLKSNIVKREIDFIIPVSEPELRFFSSNKIFNQISRAKMIIPSLSALEIGFDKLKTAQFLEDLGLPFPKTELITNKDHGIRFPLIVKARSGSGSKEVHKVLDKPAFDFFSSAYPDFIVQEFLNGDEGEYTCGVFRSKTGEIRTIIFKRELTGGFSGYGEVIENLEIEKLLKTIATKLNLIGSINVQLRITENGPIVFEINPRFSSTVRFRDMFGFSDVLWCLQDQMGLPLSDYQKPKEGMRFYKGFNEYISE